MSPLPHPDRELPRIKGARLEEEISAMRARHARSAAVTPFEGAFACFVVLAVIVACLIQAGGML